MNFVLIIVAFLALLGVRVRKEKELENYLKPEQTSAINGIFVMFVFLRHFVQYIEAGSFDGVFFAFDGWLGQLLVTSFLFYSGYGVMYSLKNKAGYVDTLPGRTLKLLINFDIAVLIYLLVDLLLGIRYPLLHTVTAFVGWTSVGNSSWYILAILSMYLISYFSAKRNGDGYRMICRSVAAGCCLFIIILIIGGMPRYCYDTIFCFPAGMIVAHNSDRINVFLKKNLKNRLLNFFISLAVFIALYALDRLISYSTDASAPLADCLGLFAAELKSVAFIWMVVSLSTLFVFKNKVICWLGSYVFEIYVLQRLPMLVLHKVGMNKYLYLTICLLITLGLSVLYKKMTKNIKLNLVIHK